jgi:glycosyltransferase involved in cell wall biosynthesis
MRLSLIIPCYNEAKNLPLLLARCTEVTKTPNVEVVLVDNGSTDDSPKVLSELLPQYPGCRSVRVDVNQGYGFGILTGLRAARGEILAWTHADMQTDPVDAIRGLAYFDQHGDDIFVKGRRFGRPLGDIFFTAGMSAFETLLLKYPFWDINAQPTMFSRKCCAGWVNPPHEFSLDLFAYYQARHTKLHVHRFPVHFGKRAHGLSHWNINWTGKKKFIQRTVDFSLQLRKALKA